MGESKSAVFLSYASQDSDAARRIADALRAFGVEVWFDQHELRGGEAWDQKIRQQIRECALFLPVISATTQERGEGYFRREWKLAVERTDDMAEGLPFLVPVAIDDVAQTAAVVPAPFLRVQWTVLPRGVPTPEFVEQVRALLAASHRPPATAAAVATGMRSSTPSAPTGPGGLVGGAREAVVPRRPRWGLGLAAAVLLGFAIVAATYLARRPAGATAADKSIAVLPFTNLSPDPENAFFADGVHSDVITALAQIRDLKVISRASVLSYKDSAARKLGAIAGELGVGHVLEGSVRRAGDTVKVTAQLIDARTDRHLWAAAYEHTLTNLFAIQAAVAQEIATALKASFTEPEQALVKRRPTLNPEAYDYYLKARLLLDDVPGHSKEFYEPVIAHLEKAVALEPSFAHAHALLSFQHSRYYWFGSLDSTPARKARAKASLETARRLAPAAPETRVAEGAYVYFCDNDWRRALALYDQAAADLPNDAQLHLSRCFALRRLGQWTEALAGAERAVALNPRWIDAHRTVAEILVVTRRYDDAVRACERGLVLAPESRRVLTYFKTQAHYALDGNRRTYEGALRTSGVPWNVRLPVELEFLSAMREGNLPAAAAALAAPGLELIIYGNDVVPEPVGLHRAWVACLQGQPDRARPLAEEALVYYRGGTWTRRQQYLVTLGIARAHAYAGRKAEALRFGRESLTQAREFCAYAPMLVNWELARLYLLLGEREESLARLRDLMSGPSEYSANELREDPWLAGLRADPRFEAIFQSGR